MKAFKKLASLVISLTMITSSLAFTIPASAAEIDDSSSQSANANLQSNVQDGVILHAFNWSYNAIKENLPAIAAAGYSTVQTSPVQQPKDYTVSADVSGQWWKLYQPVSMQIAQQSWLGTKAELTSLCAEADKYGIKIICDIVSNHMGNDKETDPSSLSPQIKTYQPDFYNNKSSYFHSYSGSVNDSSVQAVVQGHVSNAPDLNTSNSNVQDAVISLLKDCIDCGVDGFRFDAAKHIETPDDGSYASNYWSNVSSSAKSYYKQKTGKDLFIYGEILNTCGSGRSYGSYTKYINVTDNKTGDAVLANVDKSNASGAASSSYQSGQSASKLVLWAESHDTYEGDSGSASGYQNTAKVSNENVSKAWAIVAARKDATSLFFARPGSALMGEVSTDTTYKSTAVAEVNKFHNTFVGQSEKLGSSDGVAYVARGNGGIVLANCSGTTKNISISGTGLANGTYTDTVSGNLFTVSGGTVSGKIGSTGIAVVYKASVTPRNTCSVESGSFKGETMTVELGLDNATSGTYCLDDSTPVTYTGKTTIRIGSDYEYGETINLTLTATNGSDTETTTYHYLKNEDDGSGVYVFFNAKNRSSWTAPYNVYIYDEDSSSTITYKNASWPGQTMKYDSASGYYYVEVPKTCIATDKSGNVLPSTSFNLATSPKTYVIINASGKNQQYPGDGSSTKLALGGSSKLFAGTSAKSFTTTTLKPASTTVEATDVTKGTAAPTTEPTTTVPVTTTEPTTTVPVTTTEPTTTVPVTTTEPTTTVPVTTAPEKYNYGDVDLNGSINIADSTIIQKYIAQSVTLSELQLILADVSQDEKVNVKDATLIQRYVAKYINCGRTGQPYYSGQPETTQPTTAEIPTTTQPETTQPTTAETPTTTQAQTDPIELNGDYYLFGYINGVNYGCEEDYQTLGDYHFVNGQVTATFDQASYVAVKTADNKSWFMTDGFEGKVNSVTLYNTSSLGEDADKLMVPAGTATFTLAENSDGTLTLSYVSDGEFVDETTSVTDPTVTNPSLNGDYYLFGYINGVNYGCEEDYQTLGDYHFVNGQVTATFDQASYVAVKTADNKSWFMTDGFEGKVNSVTLYNTSSLGEDADKLMVPAGTATFTLAENSDGTLTLSYVSDGEFVDETTEPTTQDTTTTDPVSDTYTITFTNNKNWSKVNCYYWGTNDTTLSTWPGEGMTYSTTSDYGEKIYTIEIPNTADHIIFNDGGSNQTVDITITGSAKYYISGGSGKAYTVATWE